MSDLKKDQKQQNEAMREEVIGNNKAMEQAYMFYYRAIEAGIPEDQMEQSFTDLRSYWLPRLARSNDGK